MLTSIDVDSESSFSLPVLGVTPKDSLLVKQITGLNPPPLNLFIGDYSRDGGIYQGRRVGNRNVVITMYLNPDPAAGETVESLRQDLYKAFVDPQVDSDFIKLGLNFDSGNSRYLVGYTETFETEIFSSDTLAQISIICPDPYIRDEEPTVVAHPTGWVTVPFTYEGTAETGFEVEIQITAPTETLSLCNNAPFTVVDGTDDAKRYKNRMVLSRSFDVGETVTINTVRGYRKILVTSADGLTTSSIIANLEPKSPWLELHSQHNSMKVHGAYSDDFPAAIRKLTYVQSYWGI